MGERMAERVAERVPGENSSEMFQSQNLSEK